MRIKSKCCPELDDTREKRGRREATLLAVCNLLWAALLLGVAADMAELAAFPLGRVAPEDDAGFLPGNAMPLDAACLLVADFARAGMAGTLKAPSLNLGAEAAICFRDGELGMAEMLCGRSRRFVLPSPPPVALLEEEAVFGRDVDATAEEGPTRDLVGLADAPGDLSCEDGLARGGLLVLLEVPAFDGTLRRERGSARHCLGCAAPEGAASAAEAEGAMIPQRQCLSATRYHLTGAACVLTGSVWRVTV